jgi:hypothetical protein
MATDSRSRKALVARIRESRRVLAEELSYAELLTLLLKELHEVWSLCHEEIQAIADYGNRLQEPRKEPQTGQPVGSPDNVPPQ